MEKIKNFIRTSLIGGLTVILPVFIIAAVFNWLLGLVGGLVQPITNIIVAKAQIREIIADLISIALIMTACFFIGVFVKTSVGKFIHGIVEKRLLSVAPGYNLIKETILQLLGAKKRPFSQVALVQLYSNDTLMTAFITDEHPDGSFTVFVPTGPNPTSGLIYHVESEAVHLVDVSVEEAMRSIISCGSGSTKLIEDYKRKCKEKGR